MIQRDDTSVYLDRIDADAGGPLANAPVILAAANHEHIERPARCLQLFHARLACWAWVLDEYSETAWIVLALRGCTARCSERCHGLKRWMQTSPGTVIRPLIRQHLFYATTLELNL